MSGLSLVNLVPPMRTIVNVHEAKTHLSRLLEDATRPKRLGLLRGRIKVPADFNAPLSPDELADFEGRWQTRRRIPDGTIR